MRLQEEFDESMRRLDEAMESYNARVRKKMMDMSKEDRYRVMRQDLSMDGLETLCAWALPEEDYEICATMMEVKANNEAEFSCRFTFEEENDSKAKIVRFTDADGTRYYHADFLLHDETEGAVVMLHKRADGTWHSEWKVNDPIYFEPLGEAIDAWEVKQTK